MDINVLKDINLYKNVKSLYNAGLYLGNHNKGERRDLQHICNVCDVIKVSKDYVYFKSKRLGDYISSEKSSVWIDNKGFDIVLNNEGEFICYRGTKDDWFSFNEKALQDYYKLQFSKLDTDYYKIVQVVLTEEFEKDCYEYMYWKDSEDKKYLPIPSPDGESMIKLLPYNKRIGVVSNKSYSCPNSKCTVHFDLNDSKNSIMIPKDCIKELTTTEEDISCSTICSISEFLKCLEDTKDDLKVNSLRELNIKISSKMTGKDYTVSSMDSNHIYLKDYVNNLISKKIETVDKVYNLISADNIGIKPKDALSYYITFNWSSETTYDINSQLKYIDLLTVRNGNYTLKDLTSLLPTANDLNV